MAVSNIRKLKKKNKKDSIEGIEKLIETLSEIDPDYDLSHLERTLSLCKSIKPGAWGKGVPVYMNSINGNRMTWSVSEDFKKFRYIHENYLGGVEYYSNLYTNNISKRYTELNLLNKKLKDKTEECVSRIDEKYRAEMRDSLIDSLLDE